MLFQSNLFLCGKYCVTVSEPSTFRLVFNIQGGNSRRETPGVILFLTPDVLLNSIFKKVNKDGNLGAIESQKQKLIKCHLRLTLPPA
jgi:hypothetical protein